MALYQEHRPACLDDMVGNKGTIAALREMLQKPPEERSRAFLFTGPSGCGKTTLARIIANELNGELTEIDSADFGGVEFIRDLRRRTHTRALSGKKVRVFLLDEVHAFSSQAQTALLKALEDTPAHVVWVLATTETGPKQLLKTLVNRCSHYKVQLLEERDLMRLVKQVCTTAGKTFPDKDVVKKLVGNANGSPRAALTELDKIIGLDTDAQMEVVALSEKAEAEAIELCRALINLDDWKQVAPILRSLKETTDAEGVRRMVLGYCTSILMKQKSPRAYLIASCFRDHTYDIGWPGIVLACWEALED